MSSRMGAPKALLDRCGTPLVAHVAGVLLEAVAPGPVVVVAAVGQQLPPLPAGAEMVRDSIPDHGPLQGVHDGLSALVGRCEAAFVAAVDLPFLHVAFVRRVLRALEPGHDAVVPVAAGAAQPLAAAYRVALAPAVGALLEAGERRATSLPERCRALLLDEAALLADGELARADPRLDSLVNVNTPEEWEAALARSR